MGLTRWRGNSGIERRVLSSSARLATLPSLVGRLPHALFLHGPLIAAVYKVDEAASVGGMTASFFHTGQGGVLNQLKDWSRVGSRR